MPLIGAVTARGRMERVVLAQAARRGLTPQQEQQRQTLLGRVAAAVVAALRPQVETARLVLSALAAAVVAARVQLAATAALVALAKLSSPVSTRRVAWNISL